MSKAYCESLSTIYLKTQEILQLTRNEDWESIARLVKQRQEICNELLLHSVEGAYLKQSEKLIRDVLALEQQVIRLVASKRDDVGQQLTHLFKGKLAIESYANTD